MESSNCLKCHIRAVLKGKMKIKTRNTEPQGNRNPITTIIKCLIAAYLLTGILLLALAFLLYKISLSEKIVTIAIIVIYAAVTFVTGMLVGKLLSTRKFLWGLVTGAAYFVILLVLSLVMSKTPGQLPENVLTTFLLCAGGGMLGGMVS